MTFTITKEFTFSAAHRLRGMPEGHQCARQHGHNYRVRASVTTSGLNDRGMVFDYGDLAPFGAWIDEHLDHRDLNDVLPQPTAEHLAELLGGVLDAIVEFGRLRVAVSETPRTWATWEPDL